MVFGVPHIDPCRVFIDWWEAFPILHSKLSWKVTPCTVVRRVARFRDSRLTQTVQLPELADFQILIQIPSDGVFGPPQPAMDKPGAS